MAIATFLPSPIDTKKAAMGNSKEEDRLLDHLKALKDESADAKKRHAPPNDDKEALKLYRGDYKPADRENYFSCNFTQAFIDRMVAQLTDNRPIPRIEHRKVGLKDTAKALEHVMNGLWQELNMQRQTFKMCHQAATGRSAGMYVGYDHAEDNVYIETLSKDQVWYDPQVIESSLLNKAEYVIIERIKPTDEVARRFPGRGALVKSHDVSYGGDPSGAVVKSPLTDLLKFGRNRALRGSIIPRSRVYEAVIKDRQINAEGKPLFPYGRRIIYTPEIVLWDGPVPYWDGVAPIDWFDWSVDPEHPWGISAPMQMRRLQMAFNEILDGTVTNTILTNFVSIIGASDAIDPTQWKNLQKIAHSLILRTSGPNKTVTVTTPQPYGLDKMQIARQLFTYAQLLMGVTDVTLGDQPGSLQSGQAIEGLQEAAGLMNRARASRLEDFYTRVGTKLMARILQFWPSDRVFHMLGPTGESTEYVLNRKELFIDENNVPVKPEVRRDVFHYLRFAVLPGSSAPGTRAKRAEMFVRLHLLGAASRKAVLQAADFQNADEMLREAEEDFAKFPPAGFVRKPPKGE